MNPLTQNLDAMQQLQVNSFVFGVFQVDEAPKARYRVFLATSYGVSKDMLETDNLGEAKNVAHQIAANAASYPKFCKVSIADTERIRWGWYLQFDDMLVREYDHTK